jgi:hypothetical protein
VRHRRPIVQAFRRLFDAEVVDRDHLPIWSAERTTLRAGVSEIEILEPKGVGAVADFIGRRGPGLFAVGFASTDQEKLRAHLEEQGVLFAEHECHLFLTSDRGVDLPGLNLVVTPVKERKPAGLLQRLGGATHLHRAIGRAAALVQMLGARSARLSDLRQPIPGFTGTTIHLGEDLASHLAILAPWGNDTPIGRFFFRHGPGIHLASAVSEQLARIRQRLASLGHPAPSQSGDDFLLIPSQLLGGARLAVFARAAGCSRWDVTSPLFDAQRAWA